MKRFIKNLKNIFKINNFHLTKMQLATLLIFDSTIFIIVCLKINIRSF